MTIRQMPIQTQAYQLSSHQEREHALARIGALLSYQGVDYVSTDSELISKSTPLAVFNFQSIGYTRRSWVGLNPFAYVSAVRVTCLESSGHTEITVHIDRTRAVLYALVWASVGLVAASQMPLRLGVPFMVAIIIIAWFANVSLLGGRLIRSEIERELRG